MPEIQIGKIEFLPSQYPWTDPWLRVLHKEVESLKGKIKDMESNLELIKEIYLSGKAQNN